jgi:DNA-binding MarR family transcriptional regulator
MFLVILPNLNYLSERSSESAEKSAEPADLVKKALESAEKPAESAEKSAESAVSLPRLTDRQKEILKKMESGIEYSAEEIATKIGLKSPRTRQLLKQLADMELIRTTASTKNRRYVKVMQKRNKE